MSANTRKIRHDDETRAKIQAAQIINRFESCLEGKVELSPQQVACGKALLNKVLPDLQAMQLEGEVKARIAREPVDADEWEKRHG